jgi:predicted enzyme related to lactoylglutathione lyase
MSEPQGQFCWYELLTTDLEGAKAFYGAVLGWTTDEFKSPGMTYVRVSAAGDGVGGMMIIPQDAIDMGAKPSWTGYIWVCDVEEAVEKVTAAGGTLLRAPDDIPMVGRFAVVSDPHGASFILFRHVGDQESPQVPSGTPGHVGWHELHAGDLASDLAFYQGQFGWKAGQAFEMGGPVGTYQLFATAGEDNGGMMNKIDVFPRPFWLYYFNVDNIDTAAERVKSAGGQVMMGPHEVPGGTWILQGLDPQGVMFALTAPPMA